VLTGKADNVWAMWYHYGHMRWPENAIYRTGSRFNRHWLGGGMDNGTNTGWVAFDIENATSQNSLYSLLSNGPAGTLALRIIGDDAISVYSNTAHTGGTWLMKGGAEFNQDGPVFLTEVLVGDGTNNPNFTSGASEDYPVDPAYGITFWSDGTTNNTGHIAKSYRAVYTFAGLKSTNAGAGRIDYDVGSDVHDFIVTVSNNTETWDYSGVIMESAGGGDLDFRKAGINTQIWSGLGYSAENKLIVTVNEGELQFDGTCTGSTNWTVNSGGTLSGTGTVTLCNEAILNVADGGTLAPGEVMTINTNAVLAGTLDVDLSGATVESVACAGNLTISNSTAVLNVTIPARLAEDYAIATATNITGGFASMDVNGSTARFPDEPCSIDRTHYIHTSSDGTELQVRRINVRSGQMGNRQKGVNRQQVRYGG
jgi:hypothetical protein